MLSTKTKTKVFCVYPLVLYSFDSKRCYTTFRMLQSISERCLNINILHSFVYMFKMGMKHPGMTAKLQYLIYAWFSRALLKLDINKCKEQILLHCL
jgi:hypothetical protein